MPSRWQRRSSRAYFRLGLPFNRFSHVAFSQIPNQLKRPDIARRLGYGEFRDYVRLFQRASRLFRAIDELSPAVGPSLPGGGSKESEKAEYPWRADATRNTWTIPAEHEFWVMRHLRDKEEGPELLKFVRRLLEDFDRVFV